MDFEEYVNKSLSGHLYDIAIIVHKLYREKYVCARIKNKLWFTYDGTRWAYSEIGPYQEISTHVVSIYQQRIDKWRNEHTELQRCKESPEGCDVRAVENKLGILSYKLERADSLIMKLKHVGFKESLCKECTYQFYDPEFLGKLDRQRHLVCFRNGVLDLEAKTFREGRKSDYISLYIDEDYIETTEDDKARIHRFTAFREGMLRRRKNGFCFTPNE